MSNMQRSLHKNEFPPLPPMHSKRLNHGVGANARRKRPDYDPVSWEKYWENSDDIQVGENVFRVYRRGNTGPLLILLHGGGYSALTWSLFAECVTDMVECQILAFDQRGHGDTITTDDTNLSAENLATDCENLLEAIYRGNPPTSVIIGHSMGGAVAVHVADNKQVGGLVGLVVIDVVEGTALDALSSMQSFLRSRPQFFNSLHGAIEWSVRSGQTRNIDAARISMPGQVKSLIHNKCGTVDVDLSNVEKVSPTPDIDHRATNAITEDDETQEINSSVQATPMRPPLPAKKYTWRIDLGSSEKFWAGWFKGLSARFLATEPAKMLLLAGIDRLDTDLTVGQMQGKFQMQVLPQCGHAVHEDVPDRVAEVLATFLLRHKLTTSIGEFIRSFPAC